MKLLVIDIQKGITDSRLYNFESFIENTTQIIKVARDNCIEVIFFQHDDGPGAGISVGYLSRIKLGGDVKMSVDMLLRISEYLKMSVDDIIKYSMRKDILIPAEVKSFICEVEDDTKNNKLYWHVTQTDVYNDEMVKKQL